MYHRKVVTTLGIFGQSTVSVDRAQCLWTERRELSAFVSHTTAKQAPEEFARVLAGQEGTWKGTSLRLGTMWAGLASGKAGKQRELSSNRHRLSSLKVVVWTCLVTLSLPSNEILKWLSSPSGGDRYIISLFPSWPPFLPVPNKPYGFCGRWAP